MALRKYEVFVRQNSDKTLDYLITKYKRVMNSFMEKDSNKKENGKYIFIWYAEIYDSRVNKMYKVFCDYGTNLYEIKNTFTTSTGEVISGVFDMNPYINPTTGELDSSSDTNGDGEL